MRSWIIALAMLALGAGAAQAQDCGLKQYDSIALDVSPERLLLPVTFGTVPKQMVFRLESAANAIATDAAQELGMRFTSMPTNVKYHRDGREITRIAHADEVQLGRQTIKNMEFLALPPLGHSDSVVGDIGTHMLEKIDLELDIAGGKLNLFSPDHCPGKTVYWTQTAFAQVPLKKPSDEMGFLRAQVMLDDKPVTVAFSTVGRSRIGMNAMRRIFHIDENSPELVVVGEDLLGHKVYRYPFKALTADGLTINNPAILVFDEEPRPQCNDKLHFEAPEPSAMPSTDQARLARCFGGDDAVLGLSVLSKLHLYISSKEQILYLTGANAK